MVDIHNHLLYGIDDGAKSLEESVDVLKDLKNAGYDSVILTPHYIKDSSYASDVVKNQERLNVLQNALKENNVDINLYLGNEIYIDDDLVRLIEEKKITSLNNSGYLLIELPMSGEYDGYLNIFADLINRSYKVILAHPERYLSFQDDFERIYELETIGVIFQSNLDSLVGKYGEKAKNTLIRLLSEKKVSFLGTDIHHKKNEYAKWVVARAIALNYISEEELKTLIDTNPRKLIQE